MHLLESCCLGILTDNFTTKINSFIKSRIFSLKSVMI